MKKRIFRLTVLLLVCASLFVSCSEKALPETADIRFSISNDRARTISPGENRIVNAFNPCVYPHRNT